MKRILLPTLEGTDFKGGVARYIQAIVSTYPEAVRLHTFKKSDNYFDYFWFFFSTQGATDLYFIHQVLPLGTVAWLSSFIHRKPYVIFLHGMDFDLAKRNSWKRFLLHQILARAEKIIVNSLALKTEVQNFMGDGSEPLVLYPTVADELVSAAQKTRKGFTAFSLSDIAKLAVGAIGGPKIVPNPEVKKTALKLLTVARLVERKGHVKVLEALERIPELTYHIVGDGDFRGKLEAEIMHRGLQDRVQISTDVPDDKLPETYCDADIFVMPTSKMERDREGFGIVYLEAQLFALPVIATRFPGVEEAVEERSGGLLIDDNTDALVAAIQKLTEEPAFRSRLGSRGRERVLSEFTREAQLQKLRDLVL